jgi:hypothetical protein
VHWLLGFSRRSDRPKADGFTRLNFLDDANRDAKVGSRYSLLGCINFAAKYNNFIWERQRRKEKVREKRLRQ